MKQVALFDRLTLGELLSLFAEQYEGTARPDELLELVGLTRQRRMYARHLSGGQRQRLSIAVALVNEPVAVLLDQPTSGLDPQARHAVWELVRRLRERGLAVVLTTHHIEEAEARSCRDTRRGPSDRGRPARPHGAGTDRVGLSPRRRATSLRNPIASFGFFAVLMLMPGRVKYLDSAHLTGPSVAVAERGARARRGSSSTTFGALRLSR